jgi:hypothetical protein
MDRWFRCVGEHAEDLTGGRLLAPGDFVQLNDEALADEHNARLIYESKLVAADGYEPPIDEIEPEPETQTEIKTGDKKAGGQVE